MLSMDEGHRKVAFRILNINASRLRTCFVSIVVVHVWSRCLSKSVLYWLNMMCRYGLIYHRSDSTFQNQFCSKAVGSDYLLSVTQSIDLNIFLYIFEN